MSSTNAVNMTAFAIRDRAALGMKQRADGETTPDHRGECSAINFDDSKIKFVAEMRRRKLFRFPTPGRPTRAVSLSAFDTYFQPMLVLKRVNVSKEQQKLRKQARYRLSKAARSQESLRGLVNNTSNKRRYSPEEKDQEVSESEEAGRHHNSNGYYHDLSTTCKGNLGNSIVKTFMKSGVHVTKTCETNNPGYDDKLIGATDVSNEHNETHDKSAMMKTQDEKPPNRSQYISSILQNHSDGFKTLSSDLVARPGNSLGGKTGKSQTGKPGRSLAGKRSHGKTRVGKTLGSTADIVKKCHNTKIKLDRGTKSKSACNTIYKFLKKSTLPHLQGRFLSTYNVHPSRKYLPPNNGTHFSRERESTRPLHDLVPLLDSVSTSTSPVMEVTSESNLQQLPDGDSVSTSTSPVMEVTESNLQQLPDGDSVSTSTSPVMEVTSESNLQQLPDGDSVSTSTRPAIEVTSRVFSEEDGNVTALDHQLPVDEKGTEWSDGDTDLDVSMVRVVPDCTDLTTSTSREQNGEPVDDLEQATECSESEVGEPSPKLASHCNDVSTAEQNVCATEATIISPMVLQTPPSPSTSNEEMHKSIPTDYALLEDESNSSHPFLDMPVGSAGVFEQNVPTQTGHEINANVPKIETSQDGSSELCAEVLPQTHCSSDNECTVALGACPVSNVASANGTGDELLDKNMLEKISANLGVELCVVEVAHEAISGVVHSVEKDLFEHPWQSSGTHILETLKDVDDEPRPSVEDSNTAPGEAALQTALEYEKVAHEAISGVVHSVEKDLFEHPWQSSGTHILETLKDVDDEPRPSVEDNNTAPGEAALQTALEYENTQMHYGCSADGKSPVHSLGESSEIANTDETELNPQEKGKSGLACELMNHEHLISSHEYTPQAVAEDPQVSCDIPELGSVNIECEQLADSNGCDGAETATEPTSDMTVPEEAEAGDYSMDQLAIDETSNIDNDQARENNDEVENGMIVHTDEDDAISISGNSLNTLQPSRRGKRRKRKTRFPFVRPITFLPRRKVKPRKKRCVTKKINPCRSWRAQHPSGLDSRGEGVVEQGPCRQVADDSETLPETATKCPSESKIRLNTKDVPRKTLKNTCMPNKDERELTAGTEERLSQEFGARFNWLEQKILHLQQKGNVGVSSDDSSGAKLTSAGGSSLAKPPSSASDGGSNQALKVKLKSIKKKRRSGNQLALENAKEYMEKLEKKSGTKQLDVQAIVEPAAGDDSDSHQVRRSSRERKHREIFQVIEYSKKFEFPRYRAGRPYGPRRRHSDRSDKSPVVAEEMCDTDSDDGGLKLNIASVYSLRDEEISENVKQAFLQEDHDRPPVPSSQTLQSKVSRWIDIAPRPSAIHLSDTNGAGMPVAKIAPFPKEDKQSFLPPPSNNDQMSDTLLVSDQEVVNEGLASPQVNDREVLPMDLSVSKDQTKKTETQSSNSSCEAPQIKTEPHLREGVHPSGVQGAIPNGVQSAGTMFQQQDERLTTCNVSWTFSPVINILNNAEVTIKTVGPSVESPDRMVIPTEKRSCPKLPIPPLAHNRQTSAKVLVKTDPPNAHSVPVSFGAYTNMKFLYMKQTPLGAKHSANRGFHGDAGQPFRTLPEGKIDIPVDVCDSEGDRVQHGTIRSAATTSTKGSFSSSLVASSETLYLSEEGRTLGGTLPGAVKSTPIFEDPWKAPPNTEAWTYKANSHTFPIADHNRDTIDRRKPSNIRPSPLNGATTVGGHSNLVQRVHSCHGMKVHSSTPRNNTGAQNSMPGGPTDARLACGISFDPRASTAAVSRFSAAATQQEFFQPWDQTRPKPVTSHEPQRTRRPDTDPARHPAQCNMSDPHKDSRPVHSGPSRRHLHAQLPVDMSASFRPPKSFYSGLTMEDELSSLNRRLQTGMMNMKGLAGKVKELSHIPSGSTTAANESTSKRVHGLHPPYSRDFVSNVIRSDVSTYQNIHVAHTPETPQSVGPSTNGRISRKEDMSIKRSTAMVGQPVVCDPSRMNTLLDRRVNAIQHQYVRGQRQPHPFSLAKGPASSQIIQPTDPRLDVREVQRYQLFNLQPTRASRPDKLDSASGVLSNELGEDKDPSQQQALNSPNAEVLCDVCPNIAAFLCSGCHNVAYCSGKCQLAGWDRHCSRCTSMTSSM